MSKAFIFLFMLFCHIFDDFYLQGVLRNLKCKSWWKQQEQYDEKYKYLLLSIINHYHINFQKEDVIKTYYQICKICLDKKEEKWLHII